MAGLDHGGFVQALLDPKGQAPPGLRSWNGSDPAQRFAIYRNNVIASLVDALACRFPVGQALLGSDFFRAMARVYLPAHPPTSRLLHEYGETLPGFVEGFGPAQPVPYLADVLRLEAARTRAWHAADAGWLRPDDFAALQGRPIDGLRLGLHPSLTVIRSRWPVGSIWRAHQGGGAADLRAIDLAAGESVLVVRPDLQVELHLVSAGVAVLAEELASGATIGTALARTLQAVPGFDPAAGIAALMTLRIVSRIDLNGDQP